MPSRVTICINEGPALDHLLRLCKEWYLREIPLGVSLEPGQYRVFQFGVIDKEVREQIVRLREEERLSHNAIGDRLGINHKMVIQVLKEEGVGIRLCRDNSWTPTEDRLLRQLFEEDRTRGPMVMKTMPAFRERSLSAIRQRMCTLGLHFITKKQLEQERLTELARQVVVRANQAETIDVDVEVLCEQVGISKSSFYRIYKGLPDKISRPHYKLRGPYKIKPKPEPKPKEKPNVERVVNRTRNILRSGNTSSNDSGQTHQAPPLRSQTTPKPLKRGPLPAVRKLAPMSKADEEKAIQEFIANRGVTRITPADVVAYNDRINTERSQRGAWKNAQRHRRPQNT